jgi:predicted 3-demethylubiquinone-9 3-methyltransferase (glyoxalase superfamily)
MPTITTFLTFAHQAEEAALFYTSIFPGSRIVKTMRHGKGSPVPEGTVLTVTFELLGRTYIALNGGPTFAFTPGFSMFVTCETQDEVDLYWEKLTAGGKEVQCGWLTDKFGLSWQVVPGGFEAMLSDPDPAKAGRAMQAMMGMTKLDLHAMRRAFDGN